MPWIGVRISWLMVARKVDLALLDASASSWALPIFGDVDQDHHGAEVLLGDIEHALCLDVEPAGAEGGGELALAGTSASPIDVEAEDLRQRDAVRLP